MYDLIEKFPVKFPDPVKHGIKMSEDAKDLIEKLLEKDPKKRIGYEGGIEEIIAHDWFRDIDIDMLLNKQLDAPFVPDLSSDMEDVKNFDEGLTYSPLDQSIIPKANMKAVNNCKAEFSVFNA